MNHLSPSLNLKITEDDQADILSAILETMDPDDSPREYAYLKAALFRSETLGRVLTTAQELTGHILRQEDWQLGFTIQADGLLALQRETFLDDADLETVLTLAGFERHEIRRAPHGAPIEFEWRSGKSDRKLNNFSGVGGI